MTLPTFNKSAHSGFETQRRRHQKSKNRDISDPQKGIMSSKIFKTLPIAELFAVTLIYRGLSSKSEFQVGLHPTQD